MADWRRLDNTYPFYLQYIFHPTPATALFACIFLPLLLYSGGVFPLMLQKPQMHYTRSKKDTASIAVRKKPLYIHVRISPYRRNWLWGESNIFLHR